MDNPAELAKLQTDPSMMPTAVEDAALHQSGDVVSRTATKDTEVRGIPWKKGGRVAMFYPSANRDERLRRSRHVRCHSDAEPACGVRRWRSHFCLGANLV